MGGGIRLLWGLPVGSKYFFFHICFWLLCMAEAVSSPPLFPICKTNGAVTPAAGFAEGLFEAIGWIVFVYLSDSLTMIIMEVINHKEHLMVTFDRLIGLLFSSKELDAMVIDRELAKKLIAARRKWIRTSDLAVPGVTTEKMALIHLLWLQRVRTIIIEDIDPLSGAVLVRSGITVGNKESTIMN